MPWYALSARGSNASEVSLAKAEDGIIMRGDNLKDVTVTANDSSTNTEVTFTAIYKSEFYNEVLIFAVDDSTVGIAVDTNGDGDYETVIKQGNTIYGDVNGNGIVNMQDVLLIYQHYRGKATFSAGQTLAADVNCNGIVNMQDVLLVYQFYRGKITSFHVN